jgi:integrase/recombinase XerD
MRPPGQARFVDKSEVERAIKCQQDERYELRNQAIIATGVGTGLRASELARCILHNFFSPTWELYEIIHLEGWQTKSKKPEDVYMCSKKCRKILIAYINQRREEAEKQGRELSRDEPLFVSQKGGAFKKNSMVKLIIKIFKEDAGLIGRATSHSCRVTFCTTLRDRNADPKTAMGAMRVRSQRILLRYIRTTPTLIKSYVKQSILD